jgi:hypothetical protein
MGNEFHNENLPSDKERASKILGVNLWVEKNYYNYYKNVA